MDRSSRAKLKPARGSQPKRAGRGSLGHEKKPDPKISSADPPYCWCDVPLGDHSSYCIDCVHCTSPGYGSSSHNQVVPSRPTPANAADAGKKPVCSGCDTPPTPAVGPEQTRRLTFWWPDPG